MELLLDVVRASSEFRHLLVSPVIRPDKKIGVLDALLGGKVEDLTKKFYYLLAGKRRERYIEAIAREMDGALDPDTKNPDQGPIVQSSDPQVRKMEDQIRNRPRAK